MTERLILDNSLRKRVGPKTTNKAEVRIKRNDIILKN